MSYYDPYQGIPQQYINQPYYQQYYDSDEQQMLIEQQQQQQQQQHSQQLQHQQQQHLHQQQPQGYEDYAQYQGEFGLERGRGQDSEYYEDQRQQSHRHLHGHQQPYIHPQYQQQGILAGYEQQQQQQQQQQQHPEQSQQHIGQYLEQQDINDPHQLQQLLQQQQQQQQQQQHQQHQQSQQDHLYQSQQDQHLQEQLLQQQQQQQHQQERQHHGQQQGQGDISLDDFGANASVSGPVPNGNGNGGVNVGGAPSRTVYLGNIPSDIQPNELLDYVRSGILESVKILPSKNCAFISFIDHQSALLFHSDCILKKLNIKGNDIRIGWGKNSPIVPAVLESIQRDGATRNVYLGNLNNPITGELITEEELREDLSYYGIIDCIKIIPEKGIAFIHFLSILSAIRCVANLPLKEKYLDKKCYYGKDRCAFITKTQQHNAAQYLGLAPGMENIVTAADREFISSALVQQSAAAAQIATQAGGANNLGNRTVYLGNLHQDSTVEEICNVVRGGLLQSIRFLKERHVCFITFIDPIAAAQFFAMCQLHGLTIHNRRIKVGWGKHSGPLSNALSLAVSNGASRNIYVGNILDFEYFNPFKLRDDFSKFGDIEQINYLQEKNCAFINFVNIGNAIKAIDGIKSYEDYKNLKINFGKDRCGNLPRQFQQQHQQQSNNNSQFNSNDTVSHQGQGSTFPPQAPQFEPQSSFYQYEEGANSEGRVEISKAQRKEAKESTPNGASTQDES